MGILSRLRKDPDALSLLEEQHKQVDDLIAKLEDDAIKGSEKAAIFRMLADNFAAHAAIEEQLFYPAVRAKQTQEILLESTEEHLAIKRVLADLMETRLDDERFDARLSVLKEEIQHHAHEEEEDVLFPKVRKMMSTDELQALGGELIALFERLMQGEPSRTVPNETRKPASI
jgi:hemerythrin superfamily protein